MAEADVDDYFRNTINMDLLRLVCGPALGSGIARTVYECRLNPDVVLKFETAGQSFQNALEWECWRTWQYDKAVRRWLAPCVQISPCGTVLVQRRTTLVPDDRYPTKIPRFITDTKRANFGLLDGRFVCHDYAMTIHNLSTAMKKATWWGGRGDRS
jgi:hypothetical protein